MPPPASAAELLDLVQKSGVTDGGKLAAYMQKLASASGTPTEPTKMAGLLVRDGILTHFQAEQLLQGKWKRFTIGKYKVLEKLGAGGMGQVFLCEHKLMRRRVAVKVLPSAKAEDDSSRERFYREAREIAAVDHPNLVRA
jgi:serine/threonine protein kinase